VPVFLIPNLTSSLANLPLAIHLRASSNLPGVSSIALSCNYQKNLQERRKMGIRPPLRTLIWLVAILGIAFVAIQFIRPELPNPPVTADLQAPAEAKQILKTACYNCHSNETKLYWFDQPVPAYWLVVHDVREARKHINFSEIGNRPAAGQRAVLYEAVSQIALGAMPLPAYKFAHPESVVTADQLEVLKKYLTPTNPNAPATPEEIASADAEYEKWISHGGAQPNVAPAPNGIAFMPEYKNWKTISSTERFDNNSIRLVLGNDIAVKAIAEDRINPWPDGTAFAKVAWLQQPGDKGITRTGKFFQVEFMIRDSKKYASTLGWGWARWRGTELKPYGKDANFAGECVGCHRPLANTNYVFTMPIRGQQ
jgi:Haem-binding domain/Cytochrome P460